MSAGKVNIGRARHFTRTILLRSASGGVLSSMLLATPAAAQLANLGAALGHPVTITAPNVQGVNSSAVLTPTMNQIMARRQAYQARVNQQATVVADANAAARAAALAAAQTVRNGLGAGGLDPVANGVKSVNSTTGLNVWEGADAPTQTINGALVDVSINQTQSRALLSWNSFNVGQDTTLTFNQHGNADWVAVNRVVGGINPATGLLDPAFSPTPSQILGSIKADGTVYVLNRAGVLFGPRAQVNLHSLLASSLELGSSTVPLDALGNTRALSLSERNNSYLQNGILTGSTSGLLGAVGGETYGDVKVQSGARINASGGFVILAAPKVSSAGEIKATIGGQVSLEAGNQVDVYSSTGAAESVDPYVRGLVLASTGGGSVDVSGSIDVAQGYISLGTDQTGSVSLSGILTSTTGVSRNGKISMIGGQVDVSSNAAISIQADTSTDTIPQGPDSVATFKRSQIDIGSHFLRTVQGRVVRTDGSIAELLPSQITIGANATILAPSADVNIGGKAGGTAYTVEDNLITASKVDIQAGAVIDVSGITDYLLSSTRNQLAITPAKRNELRDTPTYRESNSTGDFTLNGATLYVDPRISGVRPDGVAWTGSPLLEAGSLTAQTGVTASELMTKGGNVTLATLGHKNALAAGMVTPSGVTIADNATIDFSGGWTRYQDGFVRSSKLLTDDGRIVDIASADPNDRYVAVANGFVENLPQLSDPRLFANALTSDSHFEAGYVEGRDAGSLTIKAPTASLNANLHGDAVAGARQISDAKAASAKSTLSGDVRKLQAVAGQLPTGGLLHLQSALGGDIVVGNPTVSLTAGAIQIKDTTIDAAGLSGLSLQTSGSVRFAADSTVNLAAGGAVNIESGRSITFNGSITTPGGSVSARTYGSQLGSLLDSSDDIAPDRVASANNVPGMFDITVNSGALLSTRGRWVNDSLVTDGQFGGGAYTSGGSISFNAAPHISAFTDASQTRAIDLSGSILVRGGSLLDVSGGGYVSSTGAMSLSGKGGDVSLIDDTVYFKLEATSPNDQGRQSGPALFDSDITSFGLTQVPGVGYSSAILPDVINAKVDLAVGTIRSFGFKGGGTFKLVTPDLNFGNSGGTGTAIPLDFLQSTGFGTLDLTAWNTSIIDNVFNNGGTTKTGLLSTELVKINAGETLNLTQSILPSILNAIQLNAVRTLASGTDVSRVAELAPTNQLGDYDNLAANLVLGGLTEVNLMNGGKIIGAPGASITVPKMSSDGTIAIAGGTITQRQVLPLGYTGARPAIGVHVVNDSDGIDRGAGLSVIFGQADANGKYDELATNAAGIMDTATSSILLSNRDLLALSQNDRDIYYLGTLNADQGLAFSANSVTNLAGISIRNPRSATQLNGSLIATGRMVDGGKMQALGLGSAPSLFTTPSPFSDIYYGDSAGLLIPKGSRPALRIDAAAGAIIDLSGARDVYDIRTGATTLTPTQMWSNAGTLSALGGGSISGAKINAHGGAAQAQGGTLEWYNPVLRQKLSSGARDALPVDDIMASGFDRFIARGALDTDGDVTAVFGRSFLLTSPDYLGVSVPQTSYYATSIAAHGNLSITAPHIGLLSADPNFSNLPDLAAGAATPYQLNLKGGTLDIAGAVGFGGTFDKVTLESAGDIRLIGVQPLDKTFGGSADVSPSLSGGILVAGDLTMRAAQIYATTGTGNLQQLVNDPTAKPNPFTIASLGGQPNSGQLLGKANATIRFERSTATTPTAPLSAGSYISVLADNIEQAGVLRAPLGRIDLGSSAGVVVPLVNGNPSVIKTTNVTLEDGSLTSVSANGLNIPYGTTTDLTEYFFSPSVIAPITKAPAAQLSFAGANIVSQSGAVVDASGGGDTYAYEFVSGTGGSRDVLNRFNSDAFSGNAGYQYADGRQVYAILPSGSAGAALYDPIYSEDYGALYGTEVGKTVHLDAAPGIAAGEYVLLPAKYALLPGAMRLVENVGATAPAPGGVATPLLDGSLVVGGTYGIAGTGLEESQRRSFTVQSQAVFKNYSRIETTSGTKTFTKLAGQDNFVVPRLPNDAARILLDPVSTLHIGGTFDTTARNGGRGSQVDILGQALTVVSGFTGATTGGVELVVDDLAKLNANSLLIGGTRNDLDDGSTNIRVTAHNITIANDAVHPLSAPEIILATDGLGSQLIVADGASLLATGTLNDTRSGEYNVAYTRKEGTIDVADNSGAGAVLRLANGVERLINRTGALADATTKQSVAFDIGAATISGIALALDSSRNMTIDHLTNLAVNNLALSSDSISFSSRTFAVNGLIVTPELERAFTSINHLTLRSMGAIGFTPGSHQFNDLSIDAPGIRLIRPTFGQGTTPLDLTIQAKAMTFANSSVDIGSCTAGGALSCQGTGNTLSIMADSLGFGSGTFRTYGFDKSVSLTAASGSFYQGKGVFDVGGADLNLTTPFLIDRGTVSVPKSGSVQADLSILTTGALTLSGQAGVAIPVPATLLAPGARLAFGSLSGPIKSLAIDNVLLRATAGIIDIKAQGDIALTGTTTLATPSYSQSFGDAADPVTVSAGGGTISLLSKTGNLDIGVNTHLSIGGATGKAGGLKLLASQGAINLAGTIDAAAPNKGANFTFDSGLSNFDFVGFAQNRGAQFTGDVAIRSGQGDLTLNAGQALTLASLSLTSDGGSTFIAGKVDTSGVNGGKISLFGRDGVSLASTAVLDTHSDGYADSDTRQAKAGDVILGVGDSGAISVASGATLDMGVRRQGNRLVAHQQVDPRNLNQVTAYTFVEADQGGALTLRAPVISRPGSDTVNINFAGTASGARTVTIEGYHRYDLGAIAADPAFSGVTVVNNIATLDVGAVVPGQTNFLSDNAPGTIVDFVRNFDISAVRAGLGSLTSMAGYHEKPGVDLDYAGDIALASNWNLGAGTVDVAGALGAGDMRPSVLGAYADGSPRYEVVAGHEASLFQNHVNMLYRVGGRVDGEAGMLTLRAGGNLDIQHSITDGFFAFSDQTDPDYINYQLGGGLRAYHPSLNIQCGALDCSALADFVLDTAGKVELPPRRTSIDLNLSNISSGGEIFYGSIAPYSASANAAAPTGLQAGGAGDPIGSAQLFPLLADGSSADSFGIQLVGGAGSAPSANALHVDAGSNGRVTLSGETSYELAAIKGTGSYQGALQFNGTDLQSDLFTSLADILQTSASSLRNKAVRVQFGKASSGAVAFLQQEAISFFANYPGQVDVVGPVSAPNGFAAPSDLFVAFLQSTDASGQSVLQRFGTQITNGAFAYPAPNPTGGVLNPAGHTVYVRSLVRTGTGSIDVASASDVDLQNSAKAILRTKNAKATGQVAQVGGTAIYTAGHVVNPSAVTARVVGTNQSLTIDPTAYLPAADLRSPLWQPTVQGRLQVNPEFASGGGSITINALDNVLGRRDVWSEAFNVSGNRIGGVDRTPTGLDMTGTGDQRWRAGNVSTAGLATTIRVNAQQFSSGLGTLGGGDVSIHAGGDVSDLTVALDTTVATGDVGNNFGSMVFGGGNLDVLAGHDVVGGRFDVSSGVANIAVGGDIGSSGLMTLIDSRDAAGGALLVQTDNLPEIRLTDTVMTIKAGGKITLGKVSALGVNSSEQAPDENALGYYTGTSAIHTASTGDFTIADRSLGISGTNLSNTRILPATLDVTVFGGDIDLGQFNNIIYPGATGHLSLLAAGTLKANSIDLEDADPSMLPGIFSAVKYDRDNVATFGRRFTLPITLPNTSDADRRAYHNSALTHIGDKTPARIAVGGDLTDLTLYMAKSARISAGRDIINMVFNGQNLVADDATRIVAGRDITATTTRTTSTTYGAAGRTVVQGNFFALGGPGAFFVEAGRNLGPFLNSATVMNLHRHPDGSETLGPDTSSYAGGILAVGNDYNPWLAPKSADIYAFFGVGKGMNFEGLRDTYVNPANLAALDGDLFEQNVDTFGNKTPDRTRPIYAPILIAWMQANQADQLIALFGTTQVTANQAYSAFTALPNLTQRRFLLDKVYFNELAAPSRPDGNSYLQYVRGYRAVNSLFPASQGYTANDLSGASNGGTRISSGNLDLRLAAIETSRDSNITILGPGGDAILGSVVRTSAQADGRAYQPDIFGIPNSFGRPLPGLASYKVNSIPIGYEGVISLRGGTIHGFTDGDFRLNQSRLFAQQSGDITLWSSNGDLNAGQGPKSAANVPPIVLRFNPNAGSEVDTASGVVGAGIAGFSGIRRQDTTTGNFVLVDVLNDPDVATAQLQLANLPRGASVVVNGKSYILDLPSITLVAPAGTVDAGDAGVRASGDIFVAAAQVANADNFKVGGSSIGVPSLNTSTAPSLPAGAASAVVANVFRAKQDSTADQRSRITVDVLGVYGIKDDCIDDNGNQKADCSTAPATP